MNDQVVGFIGELHPNVEKDYDLKQTYVFELNYDKLMAVAVGYINYEPIPRFPGVTRDIALVINRDLPSAKLLDTIKQNGGDIFQNAQVFDVYQGEHVAEDEKSVAIRINYLDTADTLTDDKVNAVHDNILEALVAQGATVR